MALHGTLKKFVRASWVAVAVVVFAIGPAGAADKVGIVDSQKILFQHPNFDEATRLILFLSRPVEVNPLLVDQNQDLDKDTKDLIKKFSSIVMEFAELDRGIVEERDPEAKMWLEEARQERLTREEAERMTPILRECRGIIETVMIARKMTVVMEKDAVYYGGVDITDDVLKRLKTNAGKK